MRAVITSLWMMLLSLSAFAETEPNNVPEPNSLALIGLATAVGIYLHSRKKK